MNSAPSVLFVHTSKDPEDCCTLHREECRLAPSGDNRIFMGSFYSGYHAYQYFRAHNPGIRAALCIVCMRE